VPPAQAESGEEDLAPPAQCKDVRVLRAPMSTGGSWGVVTTGGLSTSTLPWAPPALVSWLPPGREAVLDRAGMVAVRDRAARSLSGGENRLIECFSRTRP